MCCMYVIHIVYIHSYLLHEQPAISHLFIQRKYTGKLVGKSSVRNIFLHAKNEARIGNFQL